MLKNKLFCLSYKNPVLTVHDDSDYLPETAPASPAQNDGVLVNIVNRDDDEIEIINYSDRSTDQEDIVKKRKIPLLINLMFQNL